MKTISCFLLCPHSHKIPYSEVPAPRSFWEQLQLETHPSSLESAKKVELPSVPSLLGYNVYPRLEMREFYMPSCMDSGEAFGRLETYPQLSSLGSYILLNEDLKLRQFKYVTSFSWFYSDIKR